MGVRAKRCNCCISAAQSILPIRCIWSSFCSTLFYRQCSDIRHTHSLQETQSKVCTHGVISLIPCMGHNEKLTHMMKARGIQYERYKDSLNAFKCMTSLLKSKKWLMYLCLQGFPLRKHNNCIIKLGATVAPILWLCLTMFVNSNKQRFIRFSIPPYSRYLNIVDIREGYLQFTVENTGILTY